ncbi:MAG: peptidoglycan-binding domain-containing protein [Actinomycetes bacterium]
MCTRRPALAAFAAATAVASLLLAGCAMGASTPAGTAAPATEITASAPVAATPTPTHTKSHQPTKPEHPPEAIMARDDQGEKVRELQVRLSRQDVFDHSVTGYFGPVTETAVRQFSSTATSTSPDPSTPVPFLVGPGLDEVLHLHLLGPGPAWWT